MLRETIEALRRPLPDEERTEFMNIAVPEGTAQYFVRLTGQALTAIDDGSDQVPANCEFSLQRLHDIWKLYPREQEERRRDIVWISSQLLEKLEDTLDSAPLYETNSERFSTPSAHPEVVIEEPKPTPPPMPRVRESDNPLEENVTYLKGVGPQKAKLLAKWGITTVGDLLLHFPARYEDRRLVRSLAEIETGEKDSFLAEVLYEPQTRKMGAGNRSVTKVRVGDGTAQIDLQWWNQAWREKQFKVGQKLFVYGKIADFNGYRQIDTPEFEFIGDEDGSQVGKIVPVYPLTEGLFQSNLRRATEDALLKCAGRIPDPIPERLREEFSLVDLETALRSIHGPEEWEDKETARYRLVFEELFLLQVALAQKKRAAHLDEVGIRHIVPDEEIKKFLAALPFKLTGAQKRVMNEIRKDLKSPRPMNRLLHGDVGSGKTIVAAYALWSAFKAGFQGALLAPTEILSEQHFYVLRRILEPLGVEVGLLEGSLKAKNKRQILADLAEGRIHVVVGTHALIQENVEFQKLGVCVVDEQHRFGVMQRAALAKKGAGGIRPDVLVMTATPIPRTMALTIYGDLDVSVLDELPPGRQPIKTIKIKPEARERAYNYVLAEVKKGRQAYVVCPLVEESEKLANLQAAVALAERLRAEELKDVRVGLVHGQLDVIERDEQMELFRAQMFDVLVSTTVIEVGVDVPNSTIMLIEDADRFGLSQLHQLRGRVGRGQHKSMCILLANPKSDEGKVRLNVMCQTQNGFEIAEEDLKLRGSGELYGTRQSGMPDFRIADLINDIEVIQTAREAAWDVVSEDPNLEDPEHAHLRNALQRFWGDKLSLVQTS
ncbi:ATP-dependent DNA helicase RecG [bacterium]|nr:MAG: ATP-dependent DNA helicase RecG [bacterium]